MYGRNRALQTNQGEVQGPDRSSLPPPPFAHYSSTLVSLAQNPTEPEVTGGVTHGTDPLPSPLTLLHTI